jgi:hypothetical protein
LAQYEEGVLNYDIPPLCIALTEIIRICYSTEDERSPKQVLRLYNQCFQFGLLVTHVIEKPVKLSARKFFGIHFHSLVIHFPEIYHLFCLRSLIPEDEERTFGFCLLLVIHKKFDILSEERMMAYDEVIL